MDNKTPLNDDLNFVAYLAGELSADEVAQFEHALERNPLLAADLTAFRSLLAIPARRRHWDVDRLRKAFFARRDEQVSSVVPRATDLGSTTGSSAVSAYRIAPEYSVRQLGTGPQTFRIAHQTEGVFSGRTLRRSLWPTLAATALGLIAIVVGWHIVPRLSEHRVMAVSTYTTGDGQRANITLPDGNTVALNVASRLDVPVDYASGNHILRLSGAALFTVLHQTGTPLAVVAGATTARVLGTSFVVRHYATDTLTTVAVRDGKVAVRSLVLIAGRQVEMSRDGMAQVRPVDPSQFSFATGVLTLEGVPLPVAILELDRWYGVDIRLGSPSLTTRRIDGSLPAGSLTDVTALLEMTFDVRVVRDGRVLTLIPR